MTNLGERIKELRTERKLTQTDIGDLLGVAKTSVSGYEKNVRDPDSHAIIKLASFFNVSTDYLLGVSDYKNKELLASRFDKDFDKLTDNQKNQIVTFIEFVKTQEK